MIKNKKYINKFKITKINSSLSNGWVVNRQLEHDIIDDLQIDKNTKTPQNSYSFF